jgi:hypothetical protein
MLAKTPTITDTLKPPRAYFLAEEKSSAPTDLDTEEAQAAARPVPRTITRNMIWSPKPTAACAPLPRIPAMYMSVIPTVALAIIDKARGANKLQVTCNTGP